MLLRVVIMDEFIRESVQQRLKEREPKLQTNDRVP